MKLRIKFAEILPGHKKRNQSKNIVVFIALVAVIVFLSLGTVACACNNSSVKIPSTFDPTAIKSVIGPENSVQMTFVQYEATSPMLWDADSKTMTIPLPFMFKGDRIPTLHINKEQASFDSSDSTRMTITINGLQEGDILLSPFDGKIKLTSGSSGISGFFIYAQDFQGKDVSLTISTTGLDPLVNIPDRPIGETLYILIKKGDPIGSFVTSDRQWKSDIGIVITGNAPLLENFNLAVTPEGKAIELIK